MPFAAQGFEKFVTTQNEQETKSVTQNRTVNIPHCISGERNKTREETREKKLTYFCAGFNKVTTSRFLGILPVACCDGNKQLSFPSNEATSLFSC